ncbi:MAG: hypothetical protein Q9222_002998 [Ikaeria aurantiellina]
MKLDPHILITSLAALGSVLAAPATTGTTITAKYDDLGNFVAAVPITSYKGLSYTDFVIASTEAVQVGGVASRSPPNRVGPGSSGNSAISPQSPTFKAFALLEFYYGCQVRLGEALAGVAAKCTFTLTGYAASSGKQVATATLTFNPPLSPVAPVPMVKAVLPSSFNQKLSKVTVAVAGTNVVGLIDDLRYTGYTS